MFQKVSELEWYLSVESFHSNTGCYPEKPEQTERMSVRAFHDFWEALKPPEIRPDGQVEIYAQFNINTMLAPYSDIVIPIGFAVPSRMILKAHEDERFMIAGTGIDGDRTAEGFTIRITNLTSEHIPLNIPGRDRIATGYIFEKKDGVVVPFGRRTKGGEGILIRPSLQDGDFNTSGDFRFYFPVVFGSDRKPDLDGYYISAVLESEQSLFLLQKACVKNEMTPLKDPIVDVYHYWDNNKYRINGMDDKTRQRIFDYRFCQVYRDDGFPVLNKRYPVEGLKMHLRKCQIS